MTSVQFVVHPLPGTQEQLAEKLKSVADRLNKYGHQGECLNSISQQLSLFSRCVCCNWYQRGSKTDSRYLSHPAST